MKKSRDKCWDQRNIYGFEEIFFKLYRYLYFHAIYCNGIYSVIFTTENYHDLSFCRGCICWISSRSSRTVSFAMSQELLGHLLASSSLWPVGISGRDQREREETRAGVPVLLTSSLTSCLLLAPSLTKGPCFSQRSLL